MSAANIAGFVGAIVIVLVIVVLAVLALDNPPPKCPADYYPVHFGTDGGWVCVRGERDVRPASAWLPGQ